MWRSPLRSPEHRGQLDHPRPPNFPSPPPAPSLSPSLSPSRRPNSRVFKKFKLELNPRANNLYIIVTDSKPVSLREKQSLPKIVTDSKPVSLREEQSLPKIVTDSKPVSLRGKAIPYIKIVTTPVTGRVYIDIACIAALRTSRFLVIFYHMKNQPAVMVSADSL